MSFAATRLNVLQEMKSDLTAYQEETSFILWFKATIDQYEFEMSESVRTRSNKLVTCWAEIMAMAKAKAFTHEEKQQLKQVLAADRRFNDALKSRGL